MSITIYEDIMTSYEKKRTSLSSKCNGENVTLRRKPFVDEMD
jgi:hypothetical protein